MIGLRTEFGKLRSRRETPQLSLKHIQLPLMLNFSAIRFYCESGLRNKAAQQHLKLIVEKLKQNAWTIRSYAGRHVILIKS